MAGPLFTLTTDFGAGSGFPAQMKAVLLVAFPDARLVDVSHEVPAFDVLAGALMLEACLPWFPREAVHLAVVDPGVGTARRALCVVDPEGRRLLGPDNGLLTPFLGPGARAWALATGGVLAPPRTATFHGRDLFAPAAIYLARGGTPAALGRELADPVRLEWPAAEVAGGAVRGVALAADRFGNVVTSIRAAELGGAAVAAAFAGDQPARWVRTFGEGAPGELVALVGSGGRVELAIREGSAAARLGGAHGLQVRLVLGPAVGP
ncbi:SAM hydrolase/SAM-dependent halogenase family protein [Anaeromyxobacter sp. Red801]|uniref:SAM hydrolase/SAM-dependent halogenase family protein n=1 Tax=Anaeromyxobacter sp. Red801 TaxID=3411632 RepID=UPI003BA1E0B8